MVKLIELLKDGKSRSIEMIAVELNTSTNYVLREMEFLEHAGYIKRVLNTGASCKKNSCAGCSGCASHGNGKTCSGCLPDGGFKNMGEMWEFNV